MILEFLWSVGVFVFIRCADPIFERYHNRAGVGGESAYGFNCIGGDGRDSAPKKRRGFKPAPSIQSACTAVTPLQGPA